MHAQSLVTLALTAALATIALAVQAEEDRSAVLERIKPVGQVAITGQPEPAVAPKKEQAPVAEAKPAESTEPKAAEPAPAPAAEPKVAARSGESIYNSRCMACHMTGAAGAPKLDDKAGWEPRIAKGMDALYQSAINGTAKGMPPRGTCMDCSDDELKGTVDWMVSQVNK